MDRDWREGEYLDYLWGERHRFAWVMRRYGGLAQVEAESSALRRYPYEQADAPHRGLIFHDEAWHWAMLGIHGERYAHEHPELAQPPAEYRELD
ncbi:hypothetical protein [Nocardia miyunensis]|uniref:hypothetical protein n=1 Tax=Nocardia miyunensis TaxID=282684 RepID=UPI00082A2FEC|nr:hypothetical protein [Nocardia miyunensis]